MTAWNEDDRDHDRRRWRRAYLLGVASVLAVEVVVAGVLALRSPTVVAGTAVPARPVTAPVQSTPAPSSEPAEDGEKSEKNEKPENDEKDTDAAEPATDRPATAPSGQRPGTVVLPDGGTAELVRKELSPDAVLPVPDDLDEATWWGAGLDAPSGASVFAGHVNWQGRTGPFAELWDVRIGEDVTVTDAEGTTFTYVVSQILTLGKDELPARATELFGQSGPHRLVLVTCGGRWLGGTTGYAENRVVVAEPA
ncbi:class F sortase [Saccharomonospora azurea]|uniref:Sortase (Surface protein transpeptidase) n=1 Tax=Saccharomonospora azurea NA-128 TaxID=882081 RepID=H8GDS0_9PSEU|nr:class F sortase [Saccharomonospora azurea]EHY88864.1 sortase (surface protein transpeptidase) [Saccharomonospora azurea NA-128]